MSSITRNKCSVCGRCFTKPSLLQRHEVVHLNEKPYKCSECSQGFTQNSSLHRHIREKHEGKRHYQCPFCKQNFTQQVNLDLHIQRLHKVKSSHVSVPCNECSCVLKNEGSLKRHKALYHKSSAAANEDEPDALALKVLEQLKSFQSDQKTEIPKKTADLKSSNSLIENVVMKNKSEEKTMVEEANSRIVTIKDRLYPNNEEHQLIVQYVQRANGSCYYVCEFCAMEFTKSFDYLRHRRKHTMEKPYPCLICKKCFITKNKLNEHIKVHYLDDLTGIVSNQHKCFICDDEVFSSVKQFDIHMKKHSDEFIIKYVCSFCNSSFTTKQAFGSHKHNKEDSELKILEELLPDPIIINEKSAPDPENHQNNTFLKDITINLKANDQVLIEGLQCDLGDKVCSSNTTCKCRRKLNFDNQNSTSQICPKKYFLTKAQLDSKLGYNHNEPIQIFKCPYCEKKFKTKTMCKLHMKSHLMKLLKATDSNKPTMRDGYQVLTQKSSKNSHQNVPKFIKIEMLSKYRQPKHQNITVELLNQQKSPDEDSDTRTLKFICEKCGKSFGKCNDLERHLRVHTKEKPFVCETCSKPFALKSTLDYHMRTHNSHRESYVCQVCGRYYSSKQSLQVHLRLHKNERPFNCENCGKLFRTSGHLLAHLKARNNLCQKCEK